MKIREGAYYRTRGGDVVGPMKPVTVANDAPHPEYVWGCFGRTWTDSGDYDFGAGYLEEDLISEVYVSDTPPADALTLPSAMLKPQEWRRLKPIEPSPEAKTLRDEFAMEAMPVAYDYIKGDCRTLSDLNLHVITATAYIFADSMMEARKK
jgi:hypothetical protein